MSISDNKLSVRQAFKGRRLLVTGVTGFVGKVWLAQLLDHVPEVGRVSVIIRPKRNQSARQRFEEIWQRSPAFRALRQRLGQEVHSFIAEKVRVFEGEISEPYAGWTRQEAERRLRNIDAIVHFAGLTDFEPDPKHAVAANIDAALYAAELAELTMSKLYVHCSTAFSSGPKRAPITETLVPGISPKNEEFDPARELQELRAGLKGFAGVRARRDWAMARAQALGWPNIYTYTKGLAEHLIATRKEINTLTLRPAIVECAWRYPFVGWNEGINTSGPIIWLLSTAFRNFPARASNHFDVIPVDLVARGVSLALAAAFRGEAKEIYQLGSSGSNPLNFGRAVDLTGLTVRREFKQSKDLFERLVLRWLDSITFETRKKRLFDVSRAQRGTKLARRILKKVDVHAYLPPRLYDRIGEKLENGVKDLRAELRAAERKLWSIEEMLRQYQPFIFEHDYVFCNDHVKAYSAKLVAHERETFAFDIDDLDWRYYWMEVQVPGLMKWCIPLLRGERVPLDDPPAVPLVIEPPSPVVEAVS